MKAKVKKAVFKGAIFDVDGVIIDTAHIHHKSWEKVLNKYGLKFTFRDFKNKIDGKPRAKGAKTLLPYLGDAEINRICDEKQINFSKFLENSKVKVFKSTVNFIKKLKKAGIKLAMASSSKNAKPILEKVKLYSLFDAEVKGANLKHGKPHPEIFLQAAKKLGLEPEECLVFEDAQIGIDAALRAKMKCVAINRDDSYIIKGANILVKDLKYLYMREIKNLFK